MAQLSRHDGGSFNQGTETKAGNSKTNTFFCRTLSIQYLHLFGNSGHRRRIDSRNASFAKETNR